MVPREKVERIGAPVMWCEPKTTEKYLESRRRVLDVERHVRILGLKFLHQSREDPGASKLLFDLDGSNVEDVVVGLSAEPTSSVSGVERLEVSLVEMEIGSLVLPADLYKFSKRWLHTGLCP